MPLTELVEDLSIYPRSSVSSVNVTNLVAAVEAGCVLPPIVADQKSKRIVDGFHRRRALLRVFGKEADTEVELRQYSSEAELFADAVAMNTSHGLPLGEFEKRGVVLRLGEMGESDEKIALVLHIPQVKVETIRIRVATVVTEVGEPIRLQPLKRSTLWMQGSAMSESQAQAHKSAPGTSWGLLAQQLTKGLREGLVEPDGRIIAALQHLQRELGTYLAAISVPE